MSNIKEYEELIAFHPGYYVADLLEELGISQEEFALRLGTTPKTVSMLVNGKINISNDLAKKLSIMLGTSIELWFNLQNSYDKKIIEIEQRKEFAKQKEILDMVDYSYFVKYCGFTKMKSAEERIMQLCRFFQISSLETLQKKEFLVNYRMSKRSDDVRTVVNSNAWIQTAINFSKDIAVKRFDPKKLNSYLPELRKMTLQSPKDFLPRMKEIFKDCGVVFVLIPQLKNSGVNGAVKWMSSERVILAMNNKGLDADKFWFSLFHEIRHVLQQKIKTTFISYDDISLLDNEMEKEADLFAREFLVPGSELEKLMANRYITDNEIVEFASSIGIHPGVVVGRLQHDGILAHNRGTLLKEKYVFE